MSDPQYIVAGGCTNPDPERLGSKSLPESPQPARGPGWFTRVLQLLRLRPRRRPPELEMVEKQVLLELRRAAYSSSVPASVSANVLASRLDIPVSALQPIPDDLVARQVIVGGLTPGTYAVDR